MRDPEALERLRDELLTAAQDPASDDPLRPGQGGGA